RQCYQWCFDGSRSATDFNQIVYVTNGSPAKRGTFPFPFTSVNLAVAAIFDRTSTFWASVEFDQPLL
ncbi:MAG: hypothetical protein WB799_15865, partial [Candidatus Sulfotelmatobacter sp.]